ncbi:MAG: PH domain-containing protein [Myxococcota bacterium]
MERRFRLAPMSRSIVVLTAVAWGVPVLFAAMAAAGIAAAGMLAVGLAVAALYVAVWLWWRPASFAVSGPGLELQFPGRRSLVEARELTGVRRLEAPEFKSEFGFALRVGVGGLWGGFGWLWTRLGGWVEFYISRTDGFVLVERRDGMPLLLTPEDPEGFAEALRVQCGLS